MTAKCEQPSHGARWPEGDLSPKSQP
jgi:hypothetical protein